MTKTYDRIQRQITKLQSKAEALKKKEVGEVIGRMRAAIDHYGITPAELFGKGRGGKGTQEATSKRVNGKSRGPVQPKYRDGQGNTWAGRGNKPRWLVAALKDGKKLEDFAIAGGNGSAATPPPETPKAAPAGVKPRRSTPRTSRSPRRARTSDGSTQATGAKVAA